ncbi:TPA: hypothetical protein L4R50_000338 [Pseudomonas aeruginosa]|nr:hypothetical protein [Pseudomonas aeruginosa]
MDMAGGEFFGLMFLAGIFLYGVLTFSDHAKSITKQMKRANDLKEAELRSRGIAVSEQKVES